MADLVNLENRAAAENQRRKGGENQENALHGKTSWFVYVLAQNLSGSSPIPLWMEERCPLR